MVTFLQNMHIQYESGCDDAHSWITAGYELTIWFAEQYGVRLYRMMHDSVVKGIQAAWHAIERSQEMHRHNIQAVVFCTRTA